MERNSNSIDDLNAIRTIMERSTRFISLSGLSGVFSGIIALAGAAVAIYLIQKGDPSGNYLNTIDATRFEKVRNALAADSLIVLFLSLCVALYLSWKKALKQGIRIWTPVSKSLVINMAVPLVTGGFFILILNNKGQFGFILPSMLIFYGLALVNSSKFTFTEIFYLGLLEIVTGLVALLLPGYGMYFWAFGFGVLHIAYGIIMYRKYEK